MTPPRKKPARRDRGGAHPGVTQALPPQAGSTPTPMPVWRWRTLPVFFAFSLGGFIGLEVGIVAGGSDSQGLALSAFAVFAVMLGLAFSRVMTRFLISRRWIKPRPRR